MFTVLNKIKCFFLCILLYACQAKVDNLDINNKELTLANGLMLYKEKPYTGTLFSKTDTLTTYKVTYVKGKKHGKEQKFFFNGDMAELRFFNDGIKNGTHHSWWNKDQLKSVKHFDSLGNYTGPHLEWYSNGQLTKELNYINGKEDGPQKKWDITGKITANYIVVNGERFGLIGSKKCNPYGKVE